MAASESAAPTGTVVAKAESFDINEGAHGTILPGIPERAGIAQIGALDVDGYARFFEGAFGDIDPIKVASTALGIEPPRYISSPETAKAIGGPPTAFTFGRMSYMPDNAISGGVIQWPGLAPESLRKVVRENIAPQLIIGMRVDDVLRYSDLSTQIWRPGWRIEAIDALGEDATDETRKEILEAQRFLMQSNVETKASDVRTRDGKNLTGFQKFLASIVRDTLTFDGIAVWTDMDMQGKVKAFAALPAGNIRLTTKDGYENDRNVFAVAVDDGGRVIQAFTRKELTFYIRNPRLDPSVFGYGYCHSEDTEVLTKTGWKTFDKVAAHADEFATLNPATKEFEWQKATHHTWQSYVGKMYGLKSKTNDLLVTPNHRIAFQRHNDGQKRIQIKTAQQLFDEKCNVGNDNTKIPSVSVWHGEEIPDQEFVGDSGKCRDITLSGDDYCALAGMYLSEGYVPKNANGKNLYICQNAESKGFAPFKERLTKILGHEPYWARGEFVVCRKALALHFAQFGKDCYDKQIPDLVMNATPRQQKIFWDFFLLGDGRTQDLKKSGARRGPLGGIRQTVTTTSRIMADQLQELAQKFGYSASIYTRRASVAQKFKVYSRMRANGTRVLNEYTCDTAESYEICLRGSPAHTFKLVPQTYMGNIGCVTVPNGILYVRRNGKPAWSGNSEIEIAIRLIAGFQGAIDLNIDMFMKNSTPNGILTISGGSVTQRQLDLLTRLFANMKRGVTKAWALPVMGLADNAKLEVVDLSRVKGNEAYFKEWINMLAGAYCTIYRFPVKRLGYRISGSHKDTEPAPDPAPAKMDEADPGLPPLLGHIETLINEYLIQTRWPHLKFHFCGKSPSEDAREFEGRSLAKTWREARAEAGLEPLTKMFKSGDQKKLAEFMEMCPRDPNMSGAFTTIVATLLKAESDEKDAKVQGNAMTSKKDPAQSESHGHASGVRRDSAAESA